MKSIFSLPRAIYTGYGCESKNNPLRLKPSSSLAYFLPFYGFEVMENNKRSAEEALNRSTSSRQRPRCQEDASRGTPTMDQRASAAQPSGSSLASICRQLPCHSRRQISNNDLLASIDRTDQHLANCLSLVESALAMIEDRSPPEISLMRERLARAEARIMGEMSAIISLFS